MEGFFNQLSRVKDNHFEFCLEIKQKTPRVICFSDHVSIFFEI